MGNVIARENERKCKETKEETKRENNNDKGRKACTAKKKREEGVETFTQFRESVAKGWLSCH